ncbi:SDR family NAD(P)-dependent oxidoreductase [Allosphingosinicella indica]|uniref:NAD(P)-dependent dehydrogenase, short-chain alcohol dehydrogenase family n=1 Tax=Allosphingosinicella indica TaxID=941907 RepID=A0A1X7GCQ6_9SPHN|nr:SDR family NAD(P)-dependent oxidoreductase [Allosphingosinicella indica]SMF67769.1 NAD(P)-dependent dehydrogenase, short-chain alcohol dehydrogenase family [Allosphingosinicella indica]
MRLNGRVAIVTGAGGGLGRCHALMLARHGAKVVVNDVSAALAEGVADEIAAAGGTAIGIAASVTDVDAVAAMADRAIDDWGRIDILVNNAGILRDKSFAKMTLDDFRAVVDVHLMGAAICTKAVWEIMRAQQFGRIVMTTSSSGLYGNFGQANYGAAKMALVGLMQTLALEGEKYGIRVNCLAPTAATQMTGGLMAPEALAKLAPDLVSPGLLALVAENAPTRAILCAGAGHFARAFVTLTEGVQIGGGTDAAERVIEAWDAVGDRRGEIVPDYGFTQAERELAKAGFAETLIAAR